MIYGVGSCCKDHDAPGHPGRVCKKNVTIGRSALLYETLRLRMKRWLIVGLDDIEWEEEEDKQAKHMSMGGLHLVDFAEGLSEEDCDRIASSRA